MKLCSSLILLAILAVFPLSRSDGISSLTQSFSCLNPTSPTFLKVCSLAFFPPSLNLTGNVSLTATHDILLQTSLPTLNVSSFVSQYLPTSLQRLAHLVHLDNVAISNALVQINLGNTTQAARFSGTLTLFSRTGLQFDLLVMKASPPSLFLGLSLPFQTIGEVLTSFFPMNVDQILSVFNGSSSLSLAVTNGFDFSNIAEMEPSYLTKIDSWDSPAVTLYASVALTSGSNIVSSFLRKYIGADAALLLVMSVNEANFTGFVGVTDLVFSDTLALRKAGLGLKIGYTTPAPEFSIEAVLEVGVNNYTLTFTGKATFTPIALSLTFTMENIWVNAFGLSRLSFGNLLLSGGISYAGVPSGFAIGAEIAIGQNCYNGQTFQGDGFCLHGKGYVGVDIAKPANNYFYVQVSSLSIETILRALIGSQTSLSVTIPQILNNALQFPNGIMASYSLTDQTLPGTSIKAGYVFQGSVSIFGASATVNLAYYINEYRISALIYASPLSIGNVFSFVGNSSTNGPYFMIDAGIKPSPNLNVQMYASVTVLGIVASVQVYIGVDKLSFALSGPILYGVLEGAFAISLTNNNFQSGSFDVSASLKMNQAMLDLISFVSNAAATSLKAAKDQVTKSQSDVNIAKANLDAQKANVCADISAKCGSSLCTASHQECSAYQQNTVCAQTSQRCSGGWKTTCVSTAQSCASYLPGWLSWMCAAWQTVCTGTSSVCQGWESFCSASKVVVDYTKCITENTICTATNWVIDTSCKAACDVVSAGINTAEATMTAANGVLQGVVNTLGGLAKAFDFISSQATTLFNIVDASFSLSMNAGNKNQFNLGINVNLNVIILGKQYLRTINFSFSDIAAIRQAMVNDVLAKIKELFPIN